MAIMHLQNNHRNIKVLEEIEILKAACSLNILNDASTAEMIR